MNIVSGDRYSFSFRPDAEPVFRIEPGDTVRIETSSQHIERLFDAGANWARQINTRELNALTGPIYVECAEPGDALAVEILEIETLDWGWNLWMPGFGLLGQKAGEPMLRRIPIRDGRVWLTETVSVPLQPMIGCLGVAPANGETSALAPPHDWAGNYDLLEMKAGNTALFPVQVPGALFSLGDLHAAMGAGEASSVAIECSGAATVRFTLRKGMQLDTPRIESHDRIYIVVIAERGDFNAARIAASDAIYRLLVGEAGYSPQDTYVIFSAAVDLAFGGPAGAVVLASIPRSIVGGSGG